MYEAVFYLTRKYPLTVTQIKLSRDQFPTARSDTRSLITWLIQVVISSKNERVFIRDLCDLILKSSLMVGGPLWILAWSSLLLGITLNMHLHGNCIYTADLMRLHQQKNISFGWNSSVRVDVLRHSSQRHPGGGLLHARRQYNVSRCISPSDRYFTVLLRSVGYPVLYDHSGVLANCDSTSEFVHWVHHCIRIAMRWVTLRISLHVFLLPVRTMQFSVY